MFSIWHKCSEAAADDTDGGSARPAEAREPKPSAQRQAKEQQQQHQESDGHPSLISSRIHSPCFFTNFRDPSSSIHPSIPCRRLQPGYTSLVCVCFFFLFSFGSSTYHPYIWHIYIWKAKTESPGRGCTSVCSPNTLVSGHITGISGSFQWLTTL